MFIQLQEQVISDEKIYDKNLSKSSDLIRKTSVRDITSSRSKSFRNKFKNMLLSKVIRKFIYFIIIIVLVEIFPILHIFCIHVSLNLNFNLNIRFP